MNRLLLAGAIAISTAVATAQSTTTVQLQDDPAHSQLTARTGNQTLFTYRYGSDLDLPRIYPLNTPSGKNLLVEQTEPYPHHRAFWIGDTIVVNGVKGEIYNAYYSGVKIPGKGRVHKPPFNAGSRHLQFQFDESTPGTYRETLLWETARTTTTIPLLTEHRHVQVQSQPTGGYLIDFSFALEATHGDVHFISDAVHYAWPFLRINKTFSVEGGGTLTRDDGTTGQESTNLQPARWIDYSNSVNGITEGVAMFQYPDGGPPRPWLTRDYGTFGPRRPDAQSGKPFTLPRGQRLTQRVGIYVHPGDARTGHVREVYQRYIQQPPGDPLP